jgi:uncharacterized membrane protein SpoIIM required for sporulation
MEQRPKLGLAGFAPAMNEQSFFERRRPDWMRLMELCDKADRSPVDLSSKELRELVQLYRRVSTDLAFVRTVSTNASLIAYLNDLAGRAYTVVYREPRQGLGKIIVGAVATAAQTFRRRFAFVAVSFAIFFGSVLFAYGLSESRLDVRNYFVPPALKTTFEAWKKGSFEEHSASESAMMGGFYASNNPRTAVIAGSVGAATFGVLSVFLVAENGAMLGVLANEVRPVGKLDFLLSSIAPHGVPELSGIIISGAAGLLLGWSLIAPGRRTRGDSLRANGKDAIVLLATSVIMMFIAAPIEGFFSFNQHVPGWLKTSVALVSLIAWGAFWSGFGRNDAQEKKASDSEADSPQAPSKFAAFPLRT